MLKVAAGFAWLSGLGFGLPGVYATWHFARHHEIWRFMGFPAYGEGVFERVFGLRTNLPLLLAFVAVCAAECVMGWLLWGGRTSGAVLALALLPVELIFWVGFSLPFGPVLALVRTGLVIVAWSSVFGGGH